MIRYSPAMSIWAFDERTCAHCKNTKAKQCVLLSIVDTHVIPLEIVEAEKPSKKREWEILPDGRRVMRFPLRSNIGGPAIDVRWLCIPCVSKLLREFSPDAIWNLSRVAISNGEPAIVHFDSPLTKEDFGKLFVQFTQQSED